MFESTYDDELLRAIHQSGARLALVATGGGSLAVSDLLTIPGASQTVVEAAIPYSAVALTEYLGYRPTQCCSEETARQMAMRAFVRARKIEVGGRNRGTDSSNAATIPEASSQGASIMGISCTASLATNREKRGDHRIHVAFQSAQRTEVVSIYIGDAGRSRGDEERLAADVILAQIADMMEIACATPHGLTGSDRLICRTAKANPRWARVLLGESQREIISGSPLSPRGGLVFPGSFHPLHDGHRRMAEIAAESLGRRVEFELSLHNVDKPPLDFLDLTERLSTFGDPMTISLTNAPTFVEKASIYPNSMFIVGADTIERIADLRYYGGESSRRDAAIQSIADNGCRFVVFGRENDGVYRSLANLDLPGNLARLCDEVPESVFRVDISSTSLRDSKRQTEFAQ